MNNVNYSSLILGAALGATVAMLVSRKKLAYFAQSGEEAGTSRAGIMHHDEEIFRNEVESAE